MQSNSHRVWADINLDNLVHNYQAVQSKVAGVPLMCVVKANAYGHGAPQIAQALAAQGASYFAVATPQEALQLRRHGIAQPILLLGAVNLGWVSQLNKANITLTVTSLQEAKALAAILRNKKQTIHVKLDTGMSRLGVALPDAVEQLTQIAAISCFNLEGIFTHLAAADDPARQNFTNSQIQAFLQVVQALQANGVHIPVVHCANSAASIAWPSAHLDMVRPGIALYGSNPCPAGQVNLRPVMRLRSRIVQLHQIQAGQSVSYGCTWVAPRPTLVATVAAGYADGLPRVVSGRAEMLVKGKRAQQVGRICMDMCMLDVTDIPEVQVGDEVTLIGRDGEEEITADEMAGLVGTISYEIFCGIGSRVPRMYWKNGEIIQQVCYIDEL